MTEKLKALSGWQIGFLLAAAIVLLFAAMTYPYWTQRLPRLPAANPEVAEMATPSDVEAVEGSFLPEYQEPDAALHLDTGGFDFQTIITVIASLGAVIMIIYGGTWALREIIGPSPRGRSSLRGRGMVNVREVIPLSPKQSLYVVRAGDRLLLLGATEQQVTHLSDLGTAEEEETFAEYLGNAQTSAPAASIAALLTGAKAKVAGLRSEPKAQVESFERIV